MEKFHFGENLQKIRESKGLTQTELSYKGSMSQAKWSKIESKAEIPEPAILKSIAKALNVEEAQLLEPFEDSFTKIIIQNVDREVRTSESMESNITTALIFIILACGAFFPNPAFRFFYTFTAELGYPKNATFVGFLAGCVVVFFSIYYAFKLKKSRSRKKKEGGKGNGG